MSHYAIGDIHGCLTALTGLVERLPLTRDDTLVLLGDYVDRGPDSKGVIDYLLDYAGPAKLITLRGNHEVMMLDARDNAERFFAWQHFGGEETLYSYQYTTGADWQASIPIEHWQFLENTLPYYEADSQIFVHASVKPKRPLDEQDDRHLYWKKVSKPRPYHSDHRVICGHTTQYDGEIGDHEHTLLIDTYAYGDQWLTCLNADTLEYWQANQQGETRQGQLRHSDQDE
ncbi:MAG: metallophosphoesterase family protein [Pseudomonadota bacterium]